MEKVHTRDELENGIRTLDTLINDLEKSVISNVDKQLQLAEEYDALLVKFNTLIDVRNVVQKELLNRFGIIVLNKKES